MMILRRLPILICCLVSVSGFASAAEVSGELRYDGQLLSSVFSDVTTGNVQSQSRDTGEIIYGTVDIAGDSYTISGLEPGGYFINLALDRTPSAGGEGNPGDLRCQEIVEVVDAQGSYQQEANLRYVFQLISPADSNSVLDGSGWDCTGYPAFVYPVRIAAEPVPHAVEYTLNVSLALCPFSTVGLVEEVSSEPSFLIEWGTADEDFQAPWISCTGASGKSLCHDPMFTYNDGSRWGLYLQSREESGRGVHHGDSVVIPAVASAAGAQGTYWSSSVSVTDVGSRSREVAVLYTPRGVDGSATYLEETVTLAADTQLSWADIVGELFGTTGAGAVEFRGHDLAVTSRTSTPGAEAGSYGQGIPPVQPEQVLSVKGAETAAMGGVEEGAVFRTNLGLCEIWGDSATVRVIILDASMNELGRRTYQLRPYENLQVNQVAVAIGGVSDLAGGIAKVTVVSGSGKIAAYLSVVDNATGDPTFIAVAPQSPSGS